MKVKKPRPIQAGLFLCGMFGAYSYDVGDLVQLLPGGKVWTVVWRGQLRVRGSDGIVGRLNVYLLDNGYWDCYHEDELISIGQWDAY